MEVVGRSRKFPLERLRKKACEAVSTASYGKKFAMGDVDRTEPAIEDIRTITGKNTKDCIQNVVRAVIAHGERTGTTDKVAEAFFGKMPLENGEEPALFENGNELAKKLSPMSIDLKAKFTSAILEIFIESDEKVMNSIINVFDFLKKMSEGTAFAFLEQTASEKVLDEGPSAVDRLKNSVLMIFQKSEKKAAVKNIDSFLKTFDSLGKVSPSAAFEFLGQLNSVLEENPSDAGLFIELSGMPSVITSAAAFSRIDDVGVYDMPVEFIKTISNLAKNTKDRDAVNDVALSALTIYGNLGPVVLFSYLETTGYVAEEGGRESVIPFAQTAEEISNAADSEKIKSFFDDALLCTTESTEMADTVIGVIHVCKNAKKPVQKPAEEQTEDDYPELEVMELPPMAEKMREVLEKHLGDEASDYFFSIIYSMEEANLPEAYDKYGSVIQRIDAAAEKLERMDGEFENTNYRETYLELASKLFMNMKNELAYAPFAYWRLSDLVVTEKNPEEFVKNVIQAKNNDDLKKICYG